MSKNQEEKITEENIRFDNVGFPFLRTISKKVSRGIRLHCFFDAEVTSPTIDLNDPNSKMLARYATKDVGSRMKYLIYGVHEAIIRKLRNELLRFNGDSSIIALADHVLNQEFKMSLEEYEETSYHIKEELTLEEWLNLTDEDLRLRCGELTTSEVRLVRAVLNSVKG